MSRTLDSLSEALDWVETRWGEQRPAPIRLHRAHATEGALGAPSFTLAFQKALDESPRATTDAARTVSCHHPLLSVGKSMRDCPECFGTSVKDVRVQRFRYPMTLALSRVANALRPRQDRMPHPYRTLMALAEHGWDAHGAARSLDLSWDAAEAHFLRSIRQLHLWYAEAPVGSVSYVDKSESQRNAEDQTYTAA